MYIHFPISNLKRRILNISLLLIVVLMTMGQTTPLSTITYISEVPLIVKTGVFSSPLSGVGHLTSLGGIIQIALAPRDRAIPSDQYVTLGKPLPLKDYKKIEYACTDTKHPNPKWMPITVMEQSQRDFPFGGLLADISLSYADSATIRFRYKTSGQILQQVVFYRPEILPIIEAYRQKDATDSIDNKIKSLTANDPKKQWMGFDSLDRNYLTLSPGKKLDLLIQKNNWNKDSCILYRVYKTPDAANTLWHVTGHLLSLDSLESNSRYILEIRYQDMQLINTYQLQTLPHWYQSPLGGSFLIIVGIVLLIVGPYQIYRYHLQRESNKRKSLEEQLTTVQTQLNPHFVFNALSSIEGLVTNRENDRANEYLSSFSDIMRDTLKNSREPMIPLSRDLDTLEKYLRVEQLRFEFKWMMEIDPSLDLDSIEFPPMLLQPVVENAIQHGISGQGKDGEIVIAFQKHNTDLMITVRDNGGQKVHNKMTVQGYGLKLTRDRIERLRELYNTENIQFTLSHNPTHSIATYYFENWIPAYENHYH
jgi:hypothetical protein